MLFSVVGILTVLPTIPEPRKSAPTAASLCWDEAHLFVNWTAAMTAGRAVQWNCSGTTLECCHDRVWMKDAVESCAGLLRV